MKKFTLRLNFNAIEEMSIETKIKHVQSLYTVLCGGCEGAHQLKLRLR